mmetsp:Transcript_3347/g.7912  ORF Transcript_3347/g.7912 Transcript_3347/m.7912 type:complete len:203 (-) Transcript_3347:852-1460(-)
MPSAIILCTEGSHWTGLTSCLLSRSTITFGSVPAARGSPVTFMYTVQLGGLILGRSSLSACCSFTWAGCIKEVWKPPLVFSTLACRAPLPSARSFSFIMAVSVPATLKPLGKRTLATWQTAPEPSLEAASLQRPSRTARSSPATDTIACLPTEAASCMASPRSFTRRKPSAKSMTPAAQSAVYSPSERPAMHLALEASSGLL